MFMYTEMYMNNAKECNDDKAGQQHYFLFPTVRQYRIQSILAGHSPYAELTNRILDNSNRIRMNGFGPNILTVLQGRRELVKDKSLVSVVPSRNGIRYVYAFDGR